MRIHARVQNSPASIRCAIEYNYTLKKKKCYIKNNNKIEKNRINIKKYVINSQLPGPAVSLM